MGESEDDTLLIKKRFPKGNKSLLVDSDDDFISPTTQNGSISEQICDNSKSLPLESTNNVKKDAPRINIPSSSDSNINKTVNCKTSFGKRNKDGKLIAQGSASGRGKKETNEESDGYDSSSSNGDNSSSGSGSSSGDSRSSSNSSSSTSDSSDSDSSNDSDRPLVKKKSKNTSPSKAKIAVSRQSKTKVKSIKNTERNAPNSDSDEDDYSEVKKGSYDPKNRSDKAKLVAKLLCRWWYVLPMWPPTDFDYQTELKKRKLKLVTLEEYEDLDDVDEDGFSKVYQISAFPGVFRDYTGKAIDLRPPDGRPCFSTFLKRSDHELLGLIKDALASQIKALASSPYDESKLKQFLEADLQEVSREWEKHERREELRKKNMQQK